MNILENKIKEISDTIKLQIDNKDDIENILKIASSNYFEDDLEDLLDKYELRVYIWDNKIQYINEKLILPVKRSIMRDKNFDYKVFMILKLLANNKQNNIVTKYMLIFNKDKILKKYNISEKDFLKGFKGLISL